METTENEQGVFATAKEMVVELWRARELLWQMSVRDLKLRYKQSLMGVGWALLLPLLVVAAGCLIRFAMASAAGSSIDPASIAGMMTKAIPWAFFVGAIGFAVVSLTSNLNLVTKIYFPREVFPLSAVVTQMVDSSIGVAAGAVLFLVLRIPLGLQSLWALPLVIMIVLFTAGLSMLLACGNLFFRDVKYLVQLLLNFGIFFTPVFFEPVQLGQWAGAVLLLNPLAPMLEGLRLCLVENQSLLSTIHATTVNGTFLVWSPMYLLYSAGSAIVTFVGAWWVFHKLEFIYAEYI